MTAEEKDLDRPYQELTVEAVVLGIIQGIVLNIAFVYAALQLGFSIGGSTVAAITGYALCAVCCAKGPSLKTTSIRPSHLGSTPLELGLCLRFQPSLCWMPRCVPKGERELTFQFGRSFLEESPAQSWGLC